MNKEYTYLLKALRGFVKGKNPGTFDGDWMKLIRLADIHSVTGILGYMVMNYPDDSNSTVKELLRRQCLRTIAIYSQRAEKMKILSEQMKKQDIDHLLFKGYIVRDYYPVPELRSFSDIDFLIHPKDRKKSDELMKKMGFKRKTDWEPVYSYYNQTEYYEIHTDVMEVDVSEKADYRGYFQHIWEHTEMIDSHVYELDPEYHLLYLLTHIAKHISGSGAGVRMYLDIALFIQYFRDSLDWHYIRRELDKLCFRDFSNMVFTVVERYFGVKSPIPLSIVKEAVLEDFMNYTLSGGTFGHVGRDAGLIVLKNQSRKEENISRLSIFFKRLCAPADELEKRYTYLKGHHWLLPAAWIHRLIKTRDTWSDHAKEAKSIMNTKSEEILKLKRIYKRIGL